MQSRRIVAVLLVLVMALPLAFSLTACNNKEETLIVYNWADYIDESVIEIFEEEYEKEFGVPIKVTYSTFDTNETMLTKVMNNDAYVDVACPSEYAIQKLLKADALYKPNKENIPNEANIDANIAKKVKEVFGEELYDYMVPYMWGTLGIMYNADEIDPEEAEAAGWGLLWNSTDVKGSKEGESLNGKILMKDSIRDAYAAAVMYLKEQNRLPQKYVNYSVADLINCVEPDMIIAVEKALTEQKSHLSGYEVDFGKDDIIEGRAWVDLAWSGDALYAIEEAGDVDIRYFVPEIDGAQCGNIWFDGWIIPKTAENKRGAESFINFLCRPEIGILNAIYIGYSSAIDKEVYRNSEEVILTLEDNEYDPEEFFSDEARYPDTTLTTLGVMQDFGEANDAVVSMWERVRTSNAEGLQTWAIVLIALAVIVGVGAIIVVTYYIIDNKKKSRRKLVNPKE